MNPVPPQDDRIGNQGVEELFTALGSGPQGLTSEQARERRRNLERQHRRYFQVPQAVQLWLSQFASPVTLMLIGAAVLTLSLGNVTDAEIILLIVFIGAVLGFWQEYSASRIMRALNKLVTARITVLRGGTPAEVTTAEVVPGDLVIFSAGSLVPGDCCLLESEDLFVNESVLTGESFPVEKRPAADLRPSATSVPPDEHRRSFLFQGSHIISGTAQALVLKVGAETTLGQIRSRLSLRPPKTDFELGIQQFGNLLMRVTFLLLAGIQTLHLAFGRPALESLTFALALAVGLTPQLLPAVISVNLAQGARRLFRSRVVVKRLASIENFGSMTVLCCDKTGTLTEGVVRVDRCVDFQGEVTARGMSLAAANAALETGFANPIDEALRQQVPFDPSKFEKLDEIPYDFLRKRLSILVREGSRNLLIVKGAYANVRSVCSLAETAQNVRVPIEQALPEMERRYSEFGRSGFRVIAVAYREVDRDRVTHADEQELIFCGFLVLLDPPRAGIAETIQRLEELGVQLKVITGDNRVVAAALASRLGLAQSLNVLAGEELRTISEEALVHRVRETQVFAEIEPHQKERIVLALRRTGAVVGYLGDGINDATAMHAADVGISVDGGVDVAKEAADIILLEHDLNVLIAGLCEGRSTFVNTLKYIFLASSANFGNMFSMAGISLILPYLPLLPKQILLTNLLTDLPEMTIAGDRVDPELMRAPQHWDLRLIQRFMVVFGLLSSVFDYLTFGVLLWLLNGDPTQFRTGWFIESVISACMVVLCVRSRKPIWQSPPGGALLVTTLLVSVSVVLIPYSPLASSFGFVALPAWVLLAMGGIVLSYVASAEYVKRRFYRG